MRKYSGFIGSEGLSKFSSEAGPQISMRGIDFDVLNEESSKNKSTIYDSLTSTQQIPLDWSKFENHIFFGSAEVATNIAFNSIINGFPFDGTRDEVSSFLDSLTGYERWVYDQFPKNVGSLNFSSSYIAVNDIPGSAYQELSRKNDGRPVLDPDKESISFQFKTFLPKQSNQNQVICQRLSTECGYTIGLSQNAGTEFCNLVFMASSGSSSVNVTQKIQKGSWVDVCATLNRGSFYNRLMIYLDGVFVTQSESYEFNTFKSYNSKLIIGSGSKHETDAFTFTPSSTFSGSLDDFKVYLGNRTEEEILQKVSGSEYQNSKLKLFYKFNEPYGSYAQNSLVLDSSANGLHSKISNYSNSLRSSPHGTPAFKELLYENPVLFPDYAGLASLNSSILSSASEYDKKNPNLIVKLIPEHYLIEGAASIGIDEENEPINNYYAKEGDKPRTAKLGSAQLISAILYVWAKQFDEVKIFLDHFSKLESYEYQSQNSVSSKFLVHQARNFGIDLPKLFTTLKPTDENSGNSFGIDYEEGNISLVDIQSEIWRRIIASMSSILRSKGTISSIKELIRAVGINPDSSIRIREYGGARENVIQSRIPRKQLIGKLNYNFSNFKISSPFLSASRIEPGIPFAAGHLGPVGSSNKSDGLFTSSSWTYEGSYRFPSEVSWDNQSLVKFFSTGSSGNSLLLNVVAKRSDPNNLESANITLHGKTDKNSENYFKADINNVSIFDGDMWYVSVGRKRDNRLSSKYFLRIAKQLDGKISEFHESIQLVTCSSESADIFSNVESSRNSSGSFFVIGNFSDQIGFLNPVSYPSASSVSFHGEVSNVRFYSKFLEDLEWKEHTANYNSSGVRDPKINFNFITKESGSFERLRIDATFDQDITGSDQFGKIKIFDYSQNNFHLTGSGFVQNSSVLGKLESIYSSMNPKFDERSESNKVRVRSYQDYSFAESENCEVTPVYEVPRYENGSDDTRLGIEVSIVQSLNEDMINMFSDFESIDNALGDCTNLFEESYSDIEDLNEIYFNRLTASPEYSNVIIFSKWFESSLEKLISQFLPSNTKFLGVNLVVESHMLERSRMRYNWNTNYNGTLAAYENPYAGETTISE